MLLTKAVTPLAKAPRPSGDSKMDMERCESTFQPSFSHLPDSSVLSVNLSIRMINCITPFETTTTTTTLANINDIETELYVRAR